MLLHAPELVKFTGFPLAPPVAATVKLQLYGALPGAFVVNVIACPACPMVNVPLT